MTKGSGTKVAHFLWGDKLDRIEPALLIEAGPPVGFYFWLILVSKRLDIGRENGTPAIALDEAENVEVPFMGRDEYRRCDEAVLELSMLFAPVSKQNAFCWEF